MEGIAAGACRSEGGSLPFWWSRQGESVTGMSRWRTGLLGLSHCPFRLFPLSPSLFCSAPLVGEQPPASCPNALFSFTPTSSRHPSRTDPPTLLQP